MPKNKRFVVHKHYASSLHYDFRLEKGGVLKSWAIPKIPPKNKGVKRLAIQVEDHLKSYINFEGEIPEGSYGAGKVEIWDKGDYKLREINDNKIEFFLNGKKLKGDYVLIKTSYGKNKKQKNKSWLFFKTDK